MPQEGKHNGARKALVEFVKANPGCKAGDILTHINAGERYRVINYAQRLGLIWPAGPMGYRAYYSTLEAAAAEDDRLHREHKERVRQNANARSRRKHAKERAREKDAIAQLRASRAARQPAPPPRPVSRPAESVDGMMLKPGCKITIAPPFVDRRWEPDIGPGWVGAITSDWFECRQVRP